MVFKPLVWYCRPVENGIWAKETDSAFGAFTPCAIDSLVIGVSHLVLLGLCLYRIWLIQMNCRIRRFQLKSKLYNYVLLILSGYCVGEPLLRLIMGISLFNLDGQSGLAPFEILLLSIETLAWCSMVVMLGLETKTYVKEFRWCVRFGVIYVLVGDAVMTNLVLSLKEFYMRSMLYIHGSSIICQVLFGMLLLVYIPHLELYQGYIPLPGESLDDSKCETSLGEDVCPERRANIFSRIYFGWMTPLMQQGYKRPITDKDVWKLDSWDETETLSTKFQKSWAEESQSSKPWLLRALNRSLGSRFWYGGLFKVMSLTLLSFPGNNI